MADLQHIKDGPNDWALIIDALARRSRDGSEVTFEIQDGPPRSILITCLKSDFWFFDSFRPNADLQVKELEDAFTNKERWSSAWWFEGYAPSHRSIPVWGIYNTQTRKGVLMSTYTGA